MFYYLFSLYYSLFQILFLGNPEENQTVFAKHFDSEFDIYGPPITCVNLVEKTGREIRQAIANGDLTPEEGRAKYQEAERRMKQRLDSKESSDNRIQREASDEVGLVHHLTKIHRRDGPSINRDG